MMGRYDLPEHNQLVQLIPSGNPTQPTLMTRPDGVTRVEWIKYFDTNPQDSLQQSQFGAYSHDLNTDLQPRGFSTTSVTSNSIGLGVHTFTIAPAVPNITVGNLATAAAGTGNNSMTGNIVSYVGTTLVLNITSTLGTGTFTAWTIHDGGPSVGAGYKYVQVLPVEDFLLQTSQFNGMDSDVGSMQLTVTENVTGAPGVFTFLYRNDHQPTICCILSNLYIIFDSYDNSQDTTLQGSKTMAMCWVQPSWQMVDSFIPPIDSQQFPLLINDAKSLAYFELKAMPHQKAEDEVGRQLVALQKWKAIANRESGKTSYFNELPSFGRTGGWYGGGRMRNWGG
jgi:hypothetical protein